MDISNLSRLFANPFLTAFTIVLILNIMVFFFFAPKVTKKTYFKSLFYMILITTSIMYLHHYAVDIEYKKQLDINVGTVLVNKTGSGEEIEPILFADNTNTVNVFAKKQEISSEDELI